MPIYSPGLPLILAGVTKVLGDCAAYFVPPLFAAILVLATYRLAVNSIHDRTAALAAAVLVGTSPTVLLNAMTIMSDTAAAALWTLALAFSFRQNTRSALGAGIGVGLAILVRPNLAPALIIPLFVVAGESSGRWTRMKAFMAGTIPAVVGVGALNNLLYGSPFLSGYGPTNQLYALEHLPTNIRHFGSWLVSTEGPILWPVLAVSFIRPPRGLLTLGSFALAILCAYLTYLPFDAWWFLRFLLPAYPAVFVAVGWFASSLPHRGVRAATIGAVLLLGVWRVTPFWTEITQLGRSEERFAAVGYFVRTALPPNAAVVAMLHSGSVRFYSGRTIVRYDAFSATRLPFVIEWLRDRGYHPYIVLDETELADFRDRFAAASSVGRLERPLVAEWTGPGRVYIFDAIESAASLRPYLIAVTQRRCIRPAPDWMIQRLPDRRD